jgi:hypothetical protein
VDRRATGEPGGSSAVILLDKVALELASRGKAADFAGLRQSPYKIPMPWIAMYYYRIDADVVSKLAAARELRIRAPTGASGPMELEYCWPRRRPRLADFAAR